MFVILLLTIGFLAICVILMGVQILLKKDGRFPNTHIGNSKALRKKGIHCAKTQDWEASRKKNLLDHLNL